MGVSDAYGSYRSHRSSLGILKFFADVGGGEMCVGLAHMDMVRQFYSVVGLRQIGC